MITQQSQSMAYAITYLITLFDVTYSMTCAYLSPRYIFDMMLRDPAILREDKQNEYSKLK